MIINILNFKKTKMEVIKISTISFTSFINLSNKIANYQIRFSCI